MAFDHKLEWQKLSVSTCIHRLELRVKQQRAMRSHVKVKDITSHCSAFSNIVEQPGV